MLSAAQHAFIARTGLKLQPESFLMACTHKSHLHGKVPHNEKLQFLGQKVLDLFTVEWIHSKYPNIPPDSLHDLVFVYTNPNSLTELGRNLGVQDVCIWTPKDDKKSGFAKILSKTMVSLLGAYYNDAGLLAARKFTHATLFKKKVDLESVLNLKEPKRMLLALLKRKNLEAPQSRLLHETGRLSAAPLFSVGIFSGSRLLAEGHGSSLKMAEHRAAKHVLLQYFLRELNQPLPSDSEEEIQFVGPKLGDTSPII